MSHGLLCGGWVACTNAPQSHPPRELAAPAAPAAQAPGAQAERATPAQSVAPTGPKAAAAAPLPGRCRNVGPMACSAAPNSHAELCKSAAECVRAFTKDTGYVAGMSLECDARSRKDIESAYSPQAPAPADSGLKGTALVTVVAVEDGYRDVFGAAYLVADFADGSCLVDVVHDWDRHSASAETTFGTEWKPAPQGFRLQVESRQVLRESLDAEELAAGESDVRSDYCQRITYEVVEGRFQRVAQTSTPGACGE